LAEVTGSRTEPVLVTLSREGCYGGCPVYQLTIFRDGVVHYTGSRFVKSCAGERRLDPAALAELERLFQTKRFLTFKTKYTDRRLSDASTARTSYESWSGVTKEIVHYHGDPSAPDALDDVENGIDRIVEVEKWIGTEEERSQIYADWVLATATH
jgi:hypothetical protein